MSEGEDREDGTLSGDDRLALACVLDTLIPRSEDGALPGAGELGLTQAIGEAMATQEALRAAIGQGLVGFRDAIGSDGTAAFAARTLAERSEILNDLSTGQPAFIASLVSTVYSAYYQHPQVVEALGIETWPPHPKGYEMAAMDESLLDPVRKRPPLYRTP